MTEIRNLLFQPLTLQLAGDEGGIHLCSRERKLIREDQISEDIRAAASRGFVLLTELGEGTQEQARVEAPDPEHNPEIAGNEQTQPRQKKRRQE